MTTTVHTALDDLIDACTDEQELLDVLDRQSAEEAIAAASDVPTLCDALNAFEAVRRRASGEALAVEIPVFAEFPDVDWQEFRSSPISCDLSFVLFEEEVTRRYFYMDRADVENDDE